MTAPVRIALLGCGAEVLGRDARDLRGRAAGRGRGLLPRRDPRRRPLRREGVRPRRPFGRPQADDRAGRGSRGGPGRGRRGLHRDLLPLRRGRHRSERTAPVHPRVVAPARRLVLVHRADDLGDAADPDGGAGHDRPPARPARARTAGGAHHGPRLGLGDHEGHHHEGQRGHRDRVAPDDPGPGARQTR